jgi:hypothetical protein
MFIVKLNIPEQADTEANGIPNPKKYNGNTPMEMGAQS